MLPLLETGERRAGLGCGHFSVTRGKEGKSGCFSGR